MSTARAATLMVAALVAFLIACSDATAAWLQPAPGQFNAPGTSQKLPALAQLGSDVLVAGVESSGVGADQLIVRRLRAGQTTWEQVGEKLNFNDTTLPSSPSIAVVAGVPYVAWQEQDLLTGVVQIFVKRLAQSPTPDTWESIGASLNPDTSINAVSPDLADFGGTAHVTFATSTTGPRRAVVVRQNGSGWEQVGAPVYVEAARDAVSPKLASSSVLAIAWSERVAGEDRLRVATFNPTSSSWDQLGGIVNDPEGSTTGKSFEFVGGEPTVAFTAASAGVDRLYVKRFSTGSSSWELIGGELNVTTGDARSPSLAAVGGRPYVSHDETVAGTPRIVLSRLGEAGDQWEVLPNYVGPNAATVASLANVGLTPWVALVEQGGAGAIWRLAPSVTTLDVDPMVGGAAIHAQTELYGLPFELAVEVRKAGEGAIILGQAQGTPTDRVVSFANLEQGASYEARVRSTDTLGFAHDLASMPFTTDSAEPVADDDEPSVTLSWRKRRFGRPSIRGVAADGSAVARVEVAIAYDRRAKRCRWIVGNRITDGDCIEPEWQTANGASQFRLSLSRGLVKKLMRRPYEVYARAYDAAGNVSEIDAYRCGRQTTHRRGKKRFARCGPWQ